MAMADAIQSGLNGAASQAPVPAACCAAAPPANAAEPPLWLSLLARWGASGAADGLMPLGMTLRQAVLPSGGGRLFASGAKARA